MKRIIRLTESDLSRIVRRVISEESNETIKIKAWTKKQDRDSGKPRDLNLDTTNHKLVNNHVRFDWDFAGLHIDDETLGQLGTALVKCGTKDYVLTLRGKKGGKDVFITEEGYKRLSKWCSAYVSNDTKIDSDYA